MNEIEKFSFQGIPVSSFIEKPGGHGHEKFSEIFWDGDGALNDFPVCDIFHTGSFSFFNLLEDINGDGVASGGSRISHTAAPNLGGAQPIIWPNEKKLDTERHRVFPDPEIVS